MSNRRWVWSHGKYIEVETLDPLEGKARKPRGKPFEAKWVKLSYYWIRQLEQARHLATYKLANRILQEAFKKQYIGGVIVLSAHFTGMPRTTRRTAIKELVKLNLVRIQQDRNQATRISELLLDSPNSKRTKKSRNAR